MRLYLHLFFQMGKLCLLYTISCNISSNMTYINVFKSGIHFCLIPSFLRPCLSTHPTLFHSYLYSRWGLMSVIHYVCHIGHNISLVFQAGTKRYQDLVFAIQIAHRPCIVVKLRGRKRTLQLRVYVSHSVPLPNYIRSYG